MINVDLSVGKLYSKNEIEEIFDTRFGYSVKGITLRKWKNNDPYIIIFSSSNGPYSDYFDKNILYYDGEGLNQNQKLTVANKAVIESVDTGRIIFGFKQDKPNGKWEYIGNLKLDDYQYKMKDGFKKYEFKFFLDR